MNQLTATIVNRFRTQPHNLHRRYGSWNASFFTQDSSHDYPGPSVISNVRIVKHNPKHVLRMRFSKLPKVGYVIVPWRVEKMRPMLFLGNESSAILHWVRSPKNNLSSEDVMGM